jgi:hypothetical protein
MSPIEPLKCAFCGKTEDEVAILIKGKDACICADCVLVWTATPPNYIGFRYDGALQSIHHIVNTTVTKDLAEIAAPGVLPSLPVADPHFIYELGPAIRPSASVPNGARITRSIRVWAAIDALLTSSSISDARKNTRARWPQ